MIVGYNTNGLAHHDPLQAIELLAELGYGSVAITLDHGCLNPLSDTWQRQAADIGRALQQHGMRSVIETGARFLLDFRHKHEPTLVSAEVAARARRVEFLKSAIDVARELGSDCVSFWAGVVRDDASEDVVWNRLIEGLSPVMQHATAQGVPLGFEPEPGMFIDTMKRYAQLLARLDSSQTRAAPLQLTLDIGHLHCQAETPLVQHIEHWAPRLVNIHLEDMRVGVHEHLMFGEGEIDFAPVMAALKSIHYRGGIHVELSRHSHQGPTAAGQAMEFLRPLM